MNTIIPIPDIQQRIHVVRGKRVITDADLARFYGVTAKSLNQAVLRNIERFPNDFSFHLSLNETRNLKSQTVTSSSQHGGVRKVARVFTEQGVAMLASVLRGGRAAAMSIAIVRAFVQLRELLATHRELAAKLAELEQKLEGHDSAISNLFETIRQLLASPEPEHSRKIGFHRGNR
jgi:phage regulator Rha-like protein